MKTKIKLTDIPLDSIVTTRAFKIPSDARLAVFEYRIGYSMAMVANRFGTTDPSVRRLLAANGVDIRPRGRTKKNQFATA